jgi:hypothetical protein
MMSDTRLTEERLRTWVLGQYDRERMCAGILSLDRRFSNVKARRPKGGPDGARDIEATFENRETVWGAVGFRASVTDDNEDKKWIEAKFKADLKAAKSENVSLRGFVFFTNIDLTPAEERDLVTHARGEGMEVVEVFNREALRLVLDSPRGLGLRFQHLGIPLSEAEQQSFFAEYGDALQRVVQEGFGAIDERLRRIEFFHDCSKPLLGGSIAVHLKQECTPEQLGHFRFVAEILDPYENDPHPGLWLAARDAYPTVGSDAGSQQVIGVLNLAWSQRPDEQIQNTHFSNCQRSTSYLEGGGHLHRRGPFATLGSLDKRWLSVYVTRPLVPFIAGICVDMNDYQVACASAEEFVLLDGPVLFKWPGTLTPEEAAVPWVCIMLKMHDPPQGIPPELQRTGWSLDFSQYTPVKMED